MNKVSGGVRIALVVAGLMGFAERGQAQEVPPLEKIQSQAELDKAITALDAACSMPTTSVIWKVCEFLCGECGVLS